MTAHAWGSLIVDGDPGRRVADLDEDEVTLAVEAGRRALAAAHVDPGSVERLAIGSASSGTEPPAWASHVRIALGLRDAAVTGLASQTSSPRTLHIRIHAGPQRSLRAVANVGAGPRPQDDATQATPPHGRPIEAGYVQRILDAESRALAQVPMGAYVSRATWEASLEARYRLLVGTCSHCDASHHPPLDPCPRCGRPTTSRAYSEGRIHTWTTIAKGAGPTEFDEWQALGGDYAVAIIELAPGARVAGMLTNYDPATLHVGQRVRAVLRRLYAQEGAWRYGTKFQPFDGSSDR